MRLLKLATIFLCLGFISASALAVEIGGVNPRSVEGLSPRAVRAAFADQTILMVRPSDRSNYGLDREVLPVGARFVAYFATNGEILVWGSHQSHIHQGQWAIGQSSNQLCFQFGTNRGGCFQISQSASSFEDALRGNVLSLRAGAPVPGKLPFTNRIDAILAAFPR